VADGPINAGDVIKRVRTRFIVEGERNIVRAVRTINKVRMTAFRAQKKRLQVLTSLAAGYQARLARIARTLSLPLVAGGLLGAGFIRSIGRAGLELEKLDLISADLIQKASKSGGPFTDFDRALAVVPALRREMEKLAIQSPATSEDLRESFNDFTIFMSQAGLTLREQAQLALKAATVDVTSPVKGTVSRDIRQIMSGRAPLKEIQTPTLKLVAKDAAKLAFDGEFRRAADMISSALEPDPELLRLFGTSAVGMIATAEDRLLQLKRRAAEPVMKYVAERLEYFNKLLNSRAGERMAEDIGNKLVGALRTAESLVVGAFEHWQGIKATIAVIGTGYLVAGLIRAIGTLVTLSELFKVNMLAGALTGGAGALTGGAGSLLGAGGAGAAAAGGAGAAGAAGVAAGVAGLAVMAAVATHYTWEDEIKAARGTRQNALLDAFDRSGGVHAVGFRRLFQSTRRDMPLGGMSEAFRQQGAERLARGTIASRGFKWMSGLLSSTALDLAFKKKEEGPEGKNVSVKGNRVKVTGNIDLSDLWTSIGQVVSAEMRADRRSRAAASGGGFGFMPLALGGG
jgi:hypothetical protein